MTSTQSEIRAFLDNRSEAISTGDLDRLMSFYSPEIVYFRSCRRCNTSAPPRSGRGFRTGSMALRAPSARMSTTDYRDERGRRGGIHADQSERNPEERTRGWILGTRDFQLSTIG